MSRVVCIGGGRGIRTLDEVAPIQSFQDCALDQLCDPSKMNRLTDFSILVSALPKKITKTLA